MSLPVVLYPGYVSIIGAVSIDTITSSNTDIQFGVVNQVWGSDANMIQVGQSIMFLVSDAIVVTYNSQNYFLLQENKIILIENVLS
jgi:hypothetical protein